MCSPPAHEAEPRTLGPTILGKYFRLFPARNQISTTRKRGQSHFLSSGSKYSYRGLDQTPLWDDTLDRSGRSRDSVPQHTAPRICSLAERTRAADQLEIGDPMARAWDVQRIGRVANDAALSEPLSGPATTRLYRADCSTGNTSVPVETGPPSAQTLAPGVLARLITRAQQIARGHRQGEF